MCGSGISDSYLFLYIILLLCTSNAVVNPAVTRGIIKARVGTLLFARCAGNKQGLHCPAKLPLQKRALINLLETTMSKRLDPEVKAANKIKFGKIRSGRMMGEGNHFFGKHHTEESNELNRIAKIGQPSPRKGEHHSDATKEKLRKRKLGKPVVQREVIPALSIRCISLTKGLLTIVDSEDYTRLNEYLWVAHYDRNRIYVQRALPKENGVQKSEKMHHAILGYPPEGLMIDHINGNGLDNRKCNLRFVTNRENCQNKHWWNEHEIYTQN